MSARGAIAYVGALSEGGTCKARRESLVRLGFDVPAFAKEPYHRAGNRLQRSLEARVHLGPSVSRFNADLVRWARSLGGGVRLLWIDKGMWVRPETLAEMKKVLGCPALHYSPDAQIHWQRSRHFLRALPDYDYCVTTKEWEVEDYRRAGAGRVLLTLQGYSDHFDRPAAGDRLPGFEGALFIGHRQAHYEGRLRSLSAAGLPFRVHGNAWQARAASTPWLTGRTGPGLFGPAYPATLASAAIGLGFLGKHIPETTTTRTFEIPAVGAFLLAERTQRHLELYREGVEAEFFAGDEELVDKTRFYLTNPEARARIAAAGYAKAHSSGWSAGELLARLLRELEL